MKYALQKDLKDVKTLMEDVDPFGLLTFDRFFCEGNEDRDKEVYRIVWNIYQTQFKSGERE